MTITEYNEQRLSIARRWLEIAADDTPDEAGRAFQHYTRCYIRHLAEGVKGFRDDLDHLQQIKDALRGSEPVYRALADLKEESGSPESPETISHATGALVEFMSTSSLEIALAIAAIESMHPELADYFTSERKMFDDWLNDVGPLAGTPWHFDHNKNYE